MAVIIRDAIDQEFDKNSVFIKCIIAKWRQ
jgi:hypothetical protein